jgi:hypothetical protein
MPSFSIALVRPLLCADIFYQENLLAGKDRTGVAAALLLLVRDSLIPPSFACDLATSL